MSDPISGAAPRITTFQGAQAGVTPAGAKPPAASVSLLQGNEHVGSGIKETGADGLRQPKDTGASQQAGLASALTNADSALNADVFTMMALFQKLAQEMRGAAREQRQSDMSAQVSQLQGAADQIRQAAQDRFNGAVTAGALQIGAGAMQIGAGAYSAKQAFKGADAAKTAGDAAPAGERLAARADAAKSFDNKIATAGQVGSGSASTLTGIGTIVSAHTERAAAGHDAKKAELEAAAKVADSGVQQANDMMQQMMDVIRDVRDKLGAMQQAQLETNRGIARNI